MKAPEGSHPEDPEHEPADLPGLLRALGGNRASLASLADTFLSDYPRKLQELRRALTEGDPPAAARAAHGLRGAASAFRAVRAVDLGRELEARAEAGDLDGAQARYPALQEELARLADFLVRECRRR